MGRTVERDLRRANSSSSFPNLPISREASHNELQEIDRNRPGEMETVKAGKLHFLLGNLSPATAIPKRQQTVPVTGADTHTQSFPGCFMQGQPGTLHHFSGMELQLSRSKITA